MRIALIEAAYASHTAADYTVHAGFVAAAQHHRSIEVMSISNPGLRGLESPGIERRFVGTSTAGHNRLVRQAKLAGVAPYAFQRALRLLRQFRPDVLYASQQRRDSTLAGLLSRASGVPLVIHLHYPYGPWIGRLAAATVKRAEHVISVSEFVRESTLLRGLRDEQVTTVHFPILPVRTELPDRGEFRRQLGLNEDAWVIAAVGRLDPIKGVQHILQVLPCIVAEAPDVRLLVCGSSIHAPGFDQHLHGLCHELGLDDRVDFLGHRNDIAAVLHASDVFCLPAEMEAFGLVFPEAMRAELPVVAARSGGVPETVLDGVTGLLSLPRDLVALKSNLRQMVVDRDRARAMGKAGRERLAQAFDPRTTGDRWMSVMESVAAAGRR